MKNSEKEKVNFLSKQNNMRIQKFDQFNEKKLNLKTILLSALMGLGISRYQSQEIKNDQAKLSVLSTCCEYNKRPGNLKILEKQLEEKVQNPSKFIQKYIDVKKDHTVVIKNFDKLKIDDFNPKEKSFQFTYLIDF